VRSHLNDAQAIFNERLKKNRTTVLTYFQGRCDRLLEQTLLSLAFASVAPAGALFVFI